MTNTEMRIEAVVSQFRSMFSSDTIKTDAETLAIFGQEYRGELHGHADIVAFPANTSQVSKIMEICAQHEVPVTPSGGRTGLVGGSLPQGGVVISLERMNMLRNLNVTNSTMTVDAGVTLEQAQAWANEADLLVPIDLGSRGSCQIGGLLSTNAGGLTAVRYGVARDMVFGLEVVTPAGQILNLMHELRKDNTGYALKHLFVGAEGTLGIITAAVLRLKPQIKQRATTFIALNDLNQAVPLFHRFQKASSEQVSSCELICRRALEFAFLYPDRCSEPFETKYPWYMLVELASSRESADLQPVLEAVLETALDRDEICDAIVADSLAVSQDIWNFRELIPPGEVLHGASIKNDVSVPLSNIAPFLTESSKTVVSAFPDIVPVPFGHLGDGNIHYNFIGSSHVRDDYVNGIKDQIQEIIFDYLIKYGGSFSAEHGIGTIKKDFLRRYHNPQTMDIMKQIKLALDPKGIMNPGKVL